MASIAASTQAFLIQCCRAAVGTIVVSMLTGIISLLNWRFVLKLRRCLRLPAPSFQLLGMNLIDGRWDSKLIRILCLSCVPGWVVSQMHQALSGVNACLCSIGLAISVLGGSRSCVGACVTVGSSGRYLTHQETARALVLNVLTRVGGFLGVSPYLQGHCLEFTDGCDQLRLHQV